MPKKTPPSSVYPAWSEARVRSFITSAIRSAQRRWPPMHEAKKADRKQELRQGRLVFVYQCADCHNWFPDKQTHMDHKIPCGSWKTFDELGGWIQRLFCAKEGWQILCRQCHQIKTNKERAERCQK